MRWAESGRRKQARFDLLFELDVVSGDGDHVTARHGAGQAVVEVHVLLELGGAADQQATSSELEQFAPD